MGSKNGSGRRRPWFRHGTANLVLAAALIANLVLPAWALPSRATASDMPVGDWNLNEKVSVSSAGADNVGGYSENPRISKDGRFVVFESNSPTLVEGAGDLFQVYLHDRRTGETSLVSRSVTGEAANAPATVPSVSDDGRYVVYQSKATNLVQETMDVDPVDSFDRIYLYDTSTHSTHLVSVSATGAPADSFAQQAVISGDGQWVAFVSEASNLTQDSKLYSWRLYLHNVQSGMTEVVRNDWAAEVDALERPAISEDGQVVAFKSSQAWTSDDENGVDDIYLYDRKMHGVAVVSAGDLGFGNAASSAPSISADSSRIAFVSEADNLVAGDTNGVSDVFVFSRASGMTTRVSVSDTVAEADGKSLMPAISPNGERVAFVSHAMNLLSAGLPVDVNRMPDPGVVYVYNLESNRLQLGSRPYEGLLNGESSKPALADNGALAFRSDGDTIAPPRTPYQHFDYGSLYVAQNARTLPEWPANSSLTATDVTPSSLVLHWNALVGQDVVGYKVYHSNSHQELLGFVDANTTSFRVAERSLEYLQEGFQVEAVSSGNQTSWGGGPKLVKGWNDSEPPHWPLEPALSFSQYDGYLSLYVSPEASDNVAVAGYRLYQATPGTAQPTLVKVSQWPGFEFLPGELVPDTDYSLFATAFDAAGNESKPTPTTVIHTPATDPVQTGQLTVTPDGNSYNLQWSAGDSSVSSYEVWDTVPGAQAVLLKQLPASETSWVLSNLEPGAHSLVVHGLNGAQRVVYRSNAVSLSVNGQALSISVERTGMVGDSLPLGSQLAVTANGAPNSPVAVTVKVSKWDTSQSPYAQTEGSTTVELTESATPGVYKGVLKLDEGISAVTAITASQANPQGGDALQAAVQGLPWQVLAEWEPTITVPAELTRPLRYRVALVSPNRQVSQIKALNESGTLSFGRLPASADYSWRVLDASGRTVLEAPHSFTIYGGLKNQAQLDVKLTTLQVNLVEGADLPVANTAISLVNPANGRVLDTLVTDAQGRTRSYVLLDPQVQNVQVRVYLDENLYKHIPYQTLSLKPGERNLHTIKAERIGKATIQGTIMTREGKPVPGSTVSVSQSVQGRYSTQSVVTNDQGKYAVEVFEGPASIMVTLPATYEYARDSRELVVTANQVLTADFQIAALQNATLKIKLYTKYASDTEWQGPLPIDWTVGIHMRVTVDGNMVNSDTNTIRGKKPGDKLQVCSDGSEGGLQRVCVEAVVDDNMQAVAELRLAQDKTDIVANLRLPQGAGTIRYWNAALYGPQDVLLENAGEYNKPSFRFSTRNSGPMKLVIQAYADNWSVSYRKTVDVNVTQGTSLNLGTLDLTRLGVFSGNEGNSLTTSTPQLRPGQVGTLRAAFKSTRAVNNAKLTLRIPQGTDYVAGSVLLNDAAIPANRVDLASKPGFLIVDLGNLATNQAGVVRFSFQVPSTFTAGELLADAKIKYDYSSGEEIIGQAKMISSQLTITAPLRTNHLAWTVNGTGPANQELSVFEGQQFLGKTTISAAGVWSLALSLPDPNGDKLFRLQAVTQDASGNTLRSKVADVSYEPNDPVLQEMTMRQSDGRLVTLDLTKGVPRFPYVVRPWEGFFFDLKFNDPNAVENVKVHIGRGSNEVVGLAAKTAGGLWHVDLLNSNGGTLGEGIYVTYDRKKVPPTPLTHVPTVQEVRDRLPSGLRDVTLENQELLHTDGNLTAGHVDLTLPDTNMGLGVDVKMEDGLTYTPSAEDLQKAAATGVPVYGTTFEVYQDAATGKWVSELSGYVQRPQDTLTLTQGLNFLTTAVGTAVPNKVSLPAAGGTILNAVKISAKVVWNEKDALYKGGNDIQQTKQNIDGRYDVNRKFDQVVDLAQRANACPGGQVWNGSLEFANNMIIAGEATKWALNLAGAALAPETLGSSLVFNIAGNLLGAGVDAMVDARLKSLEDRIASLGDCAKPQDDGSAASTPTASPVWIYDPSGFVYETFEDNRVADAKASVYYLDSQTNEWVLWDADWFGQINPQITDPQGKYGWDVPNGTWKVVYEKAGYETTESGAMEVPPPRFNVNIPMVSQLPPTVSATSAQATDSGTVIEFSTDKYVQTASLTTSSLTVQVDGAPVAGTLTAVEARTDAHDVSLARKFRFHTTQRLAAGQQVSLALLAANVVSYAGSPAQPDAGQDTLTLTITVQAADTSAPTLTGAATDVNGNVITLTFNEALNTQKALDRTLFTLQGTTAAPASVEYGADGQTLKLFLDGKTAPSGVSVHLAANAVEDRFQNAAGALSRAVADNAVSSDAALQSLVIAGNAYPMTPAFSPNVTSYTVAVPNATTSTTIRAAASNSEAAMRFEGFALPSNTDRAFKLAASGDTVVTLGVTAADGTTARQYQITITHVSVPPVNNGGGGTIPTPAPTGALSLDDVKKSLSGSTLTIDLTQPQAASALQGDAWAYLKEKGAVLILKQGGRSLSLPSTAFGDQIEKQLGALDSKIALNFAWNEVAGDTAADWFRRAAQADAAYQPASSALQLKVTATSGSQSLVLQPAGELRVTLPLPQAADLSKLGVYQFDSAANKWSYVRSTLNAKNGLVTVTVSNGQPLALLRYAKSFSDIAEHWARGPIEHLAAHHIISGQTDTAFNPEGNITRAEFVALLDRLLGLPNPHQPVSFPDINSVEWYTDSVARVAAAGIVHGYADGSFQPNGQITREQMVVMAVGALRIARTLDPLAEAQQAELLAPYADSGSISGWAREAFAQAVKIGLVSGVSADLLAPGELLTRAQAAAILDRYPQPTF